MRRFGFGFSTLLGCLSSRIVFLTAAHDEREHHGTHHHDHHHHLEYPQLRRRNRRLFFLLRRSGEDHNHEDSLNAYVDTGDEIEDDGNKAVCATEFSEAWDDAAQRTALRSYRNRRSSESLTARVVIPVCFFDVYGVRGSNQQPVADSVLQRQLDILNTGFSATSCCNTRRPWCNPGMCSIDSGFSFAWAVLDPNTGKVIPGATTPNIADPGACVQRVQNQRWAYVGAFDFFRNKAMRQQLHQGDFTVLNVYLISSPAFQGLATVPWRNRNQDELSLDSVILDKEAIVGSSVLGRTEGKTLVHEVGHWLGLVHTFQGGCHKSDGIDDTAPQKLPNRGCANNANSRNTCPHHPGNDPVFNFMDYSSDQCLYEFTPGQVTMMHAVWEYFRLRLTDIDDIQLTSGIASDPVALIPNTRQYYFMQTTNRQVECKFTTAEGKAVMAVNWGSKPRFSFWHDSCRKKGFDGSCNSRNKQNDAIVYVGVETGPEIPVSGLVVVCSDA